MAILLSTLLLFSSFGNSTSAVGVDTNHFDAGYCTFDAAEQAYNEWGIYPPWYGDAGDWIAGARASGWNVSAAPQVNTIIVLPRGDQGSGALGHVAWVMGVEDDGTTVDVRSMNWIGRGKVNFHQLQADGLAQFLTPPSDAEISMTAPR
jgi:surface antigen